MENPSFQTVRLSRGKHVSPDDGACVMELASMLAGETFTDHPRSVCPVIAAVLRAYNDGTDDVRRQDLYAYAAASVGTRSRRARRARLQRCLEFFDQPSAPWLLLLSRTRTLCVEVMSYARNTDAEGHRRFLALMDELTEREALMPVAAADAPAAAAPRPRQQVAR